MSGDDDDDFGSFTAATPAVSSQNPSTITAPQTSAPIAATAAPTDAADSSKPVTNVQPSVSAQNSKPIDLDEDEDFGGFTSSVVANTTNGAVAATAEPGHASVGGHSNGASAAPAPVSHAPTASPSPRASKITDDDLERMLSEMTEDEPGGAENGAASKATHATSAVNGDGSAVKASPAKKRVSIGSLGLDEHAEGDGMATEDDLEALLGSDEV